MLAQLIAGLPAGARLTDMVAFPPGFRAWVQIQLTGGIGGEVDRGSDRVWDYDPAGAWHLSVQSVDAAGQLQTRLPDRPMLGTVLVYDDIQYHWHAGIQPGLGLHSLRASHARVLYRSSPWPLATKGRAPF